MKELENEREQQEEQEQYRYHTNKQYHTRLDWYQVTYFFVLLVL